VQPHFDPYQHWLGIPPAEQPPHHYRLLGIPPLEPNPDVIRQAAERQAANVRRYQSSQYLAVTNKLLGDIAAAASCLLDPKAKAVYDAELRQRLPAAVHAPPWGAGGSAPGMSPSSYPQAAPPGFASQSSQAPPPAPPPAAPPAGPLPVAAPIPIRQQDTWAPGPAPAVPAFPSRPIRRRRSTGMPAMALFLMSLVVLGTVLFVIFRSEGIGGGDKPGIQVANTPGAGGGDGTGMEPVGPERRPEGPLPDGPANGYDPGDDPDDGATGDTSVSPEVPEPEPEAKTTERLGNAEVAILSATIEKEPSAGSLRGGDLTLSDPNDTSLILNLELRNLSQTEPLKYLSWDGLRAFDVPVTLRDDWGRSYRQQTPLDRAYADQPDAAANVYVLTDDNFGERVLEAEKPVLVQFYAPWSEACQSLKGQVDHLSAAYADRAIVGRFQVLDADEPGKYKMTPVLTRYKINSIPAVIVFSKGRPAAGWRGAPPLSTMEEALDALLPPKPPPHETIEPGAVVQQRLIFEPPADDAKTLRLTLPASAVGEEGVFELVIPRGMVSEGGNNGQVGEPR
jgi:thiol-disulfide isomerase/thioredoxin